MHARVLFRNAYRGFAVAVALLAVALTACVASSGAPDVPPAQAAQPDSGSENVAAGSDDRTYGEDEEYIVQPYYLRPSDQPYVKAYEEAATRCCAEVREFYRTQCGVTFRMAPLRVVQSRQTYAEMRWGEAPATDDIRAFPNWVESVLRAVGGRRDRRVAWVFAQGGGGMAVGNLQDDHRGFGIFGDWVLEPLSGVENPDGVSARLATWEVEGGVPMGTTVHELGHAFGLHHPEKGRTGRSLTGRSLMGWHGDYPRVGFLDHEIRFLRASPFFTGEGPPADAPFPSFATADRVGNGSILEIPGERFAEGDVVQFERADGVPLRLVPQSVTPERLTVLVNTGAAATSGFFRVVRPSNDGSPLSSHPIPLNVFESGASAEPAPAEPAPPE